MNVLNFSPIPVHERGIIMRLLQESHKEFSRDLIRKWEKDWKRFDNDVFDHPDTVGPCGFITYQGKSIIGFASWDPRQHPSAIIGHNCILPAFRRNGHGKRQIKEMLGRLKALKFSKARVTTGDHPGFISAQRMYLMCGFCETRRYSDRTDTNWRMVEFEKDLLNRRLQPTPLGDAAES
jgi:hypothetical protein